MKKWFFIVGVIIILIIVYIWYDSRCNYSNVKSCDMSCKTDNDCKALRIKSGEGCINKKERIYGHSPFEEVDIVISIRCLCINNKCKTIRCSDLDFSITRLGASSFIIKREFGEETKDVDLIVIIDRTLAKNFTWDRQPNWSKPYEEAKLILDNPDISKIEIFAKFRGRLCPIAAEYNVNS